MNHSLNSIRWSTTVGAWSNLIKPKIAYYIYIMFSNYSIRYYIIDFASLMKCIGLYVTTLIGSVITVKNTGKCKYLWIFPSFFLTSQNIIIFNCGVVSIVLVFFIFVIFKLFLNDIVHLWHCSWTHWNRLHLCHLTLVDL